MEQERDARAETEALMAQLAERGVDVRWSVLGTGRIILDLPSDDGKDIQTVLVDDETLATIARRLEEAGPLAMLVWRYPDVASGEVAGQRYWEIRQFRQIH